MRTKFILCLSAIWLFQALATCTATPASDYVAKLLSVAAKYPEHLKDHSTPRIIEPIWPTFDCPVIRSDPRPTSVHKLRPADIDVVFAYGDSVTAGNGLGATWIGGVAIENRGESWSIGGDGTVEEDFMTLPNILKKYNPDLKGWSRCSSGRFDYKYTWMNVARPGATSVDMPSQSQNIVDRIGNDTRVNADEDWKMASMLIGGNDLCAVCRNSKYCPKSYAAEIEKALDILHARTTRMYVNIVPMFDVTPLKDMARNALCRYMHTQFCNCAVNETFRVQMRNIQLGYYNELVNLVESGKYEREDFTVVIQPYLRDLIPPEDPEIPGQLDSSFLSHECFHPSRQFHRVMGLGLYSSMMLPYGEKVYEVDHEVLDPPYICPTDENPYIFTKGNSPIAAPPAPSPMLPLPDVDPILCPELYPATTAAGTAAQTTA